MRYFTQLFLGHADLGRDIHGQISPRMREEDNYEARMSIKKLVTVMAPGNV